MCVKTAGRSGGFGEKHSLRYGRAEARWNWRIAARPFGLAIANRIDSIWSDTVLVAHIWRFHVPAQREIKRVRSHCREIASKEPKSGIRIF